MTPYIFFERSAEKKSARATKGTKEYCYGTNFKFQLGQPNSDERETKTNPDSNCCVYDNGVISGSFKKKVQYSTG